MGDFSPNVTLPNQRVRDYILVESLPTPPPIKSLKLFKAKKDGTDELYVVKIVRVNPYPEKETQDDMNAILYIHLEHVNLSALRDEAGVVRSHGLFIEWKSEQCMEKGKSKTRQVKLICLVVDSYISKPETHHALLYRNRITLKTHMQKEGRLWEDVAIILFAQLVYTVHRVHKHNIVLLDLRPSRIMMDAVTQELTLANFFPTERLQNGQQLLTKAWGASEYISPEALTGKPFSGKAVDVWSLGITFYWMLFGAFPFPSHDMEELVRKVSVGEYDIPKEIAVREETRTLLKSLLTVDPSKRITASEAVEEVVNMVITIAQDLRRMIKAETRIGVIKGR